ncbi:Lsr2 family protein [Pilimelia terevasa]|uniref:Lsr2 family protein n=1 Tax=Pilimelia terevasa TaxID=53372 RepID=A0A8J3BNJ6_9ACTN|nr:Lsr2 family protein [Pilimelia terevasa]GGK16465.1 Lsr2 family protein [Pilimelia terevasa]
MARQTITVLTDDLDGATADESVSFALDGVQYEIDLSAKNAERLRKALAPYVEKGTRVGRGGMESGRRGRSVRGSGPAGGDREQNKAIRDWAKETGKDVSERGRIPASLVAEFQAAH